MTATLNTTLAEPLIEACSEGRYSDIVALLENGADANSEVQEMGRNGLRTVRPLTATYRVLARGDTMPKLAQRQAHRIMSLLLGSGATMRIVEREMLVYAIRMGLPETLNFLVEQGARVHRYGHELMEVAILGLRLNCIQALASLGLDANIRDQWGSTTFLDICSGKLHMEVKGQRQAEAHSVSEVVSQFSELMAHGVDINVTDRIGATPLMRSIVMRQDAITMALLECGARTDTSLRNGVCAAHLAASSGSVSRLRSMLTRGEVIRDLERLVAKGLQPDVKAFLAARAMDTRPTRTQLA